MAGGEDVEDFTDEDPGVIVGEEDLTNEPLIEPIGPCIVPAGEPLPQGS